jgi:hypothetical protein
VFEAKYHYEFWRPITAIRSGDIDGNLATEIDPSWQPLDATPMHPEYPEVSLTSPTAPGITHRWSSLTAFTNEVANARVWAGFRYRSSSRVGTAMRGEVGRYGAANFAPPETK